MTAKGGDLRTDGNYVPGIGKNALGRAPEIGVQILNSTVDSFRLTEKGGTDYVYDDLHTKELPGIPAENISICGSTIALTNTGNVRSAASMILDTAMSMGF